MADSKYPIKGGEPVSTERKMQRRAGFSLILVLIVFLIGVSVTGGVLYTMSSYSGGARAGVIAEAGYNVMQDGLEQGRTALRERFSTLGSDDLPHRGTIGSKIKKMEDLLIQNGTVINERDVPVKELGGKSGKLTVKIYDLQYVSEDIDPTLRSDDAAMMKMPPAMHIPPDDSDSVVTVGVDAEAGIRRPDAGVYLIRSSLTVGTDEKSLESIVVQGNK